MLKKIIILLIVVILALVGYHFISGHSDTKKAEQTSTATAQGNVLQLDEDKKEPEPEAAPSTVRATTQQDIPVATLTSIPQPQLDGHAYFLLDYNSGQVIAGLNEDERVEPASLTKLMTSALVFDALKHNKISLDQMVTVTPEARAQEGSRMFIEVNTQVSVDDLIQGMIVQSGNDAAVQLAQAVSGSVPVFVQKMNERAQQWGLTNSHFNDPAGLPSPETYVSARDIVTLSHHIIKDYHDYYHYFKQPEFTYAKIKQGNRNGLLFRDVGVDGLKTGHTQSAGYNLAASANRNDRRLIAVVMGTKSFKERERSNQTLLDWGYANFADKVVAEPGKEVTKVRIREGKIKDLPVGSPDQLVVTIPSGQDSKLQVSTQFDRVIKAPIKKGQVVGTVHYDFDGKRLKSDKLIALQDVDRASFFARIWDKITGMFSSN